MFLFSLRRRIAEWRRIHDPFFRLREVEGKLQNLMLNMAYERGDDSLWYPQILGPEETLKYVIDKKCSLARYGDGEFELMVGRDMSFERANKVMKNRLIEILRHPRQDCLNCVPNVFGSLARYRLPVQEFWRGAVQWMRPILKSCVMVLDAKGIAQNAILGDPQVSRAYLGIGSGEWAERLFGLWKEIFKGRDILVVEGRYSRLGVGNDLFSEAKSLRRIWCPATGAYSRIDAIKEAILNNASKTDLVLLALGATATILAYDLSGEGLQALDVGHIDLEYMWMKMGATKKVPIKGRYVNECAINGREMVKVAGEEKELNVVAVI